MAICCLDSKIQDPEARWSENTLLTNVLGKHNTMIICYFNQLTFVDSAYNSHPANNLVCVLVLSIEYCFFPTDFPRHTYIGPALRPQLDNFEI